MPFLLLRPQYLTIKNKLVRDAKARFNMQRDFLLLGTAVLTMVCIYVGFHMVFSSVVGNPLFEFIVPSKLIELLYYAFFLVLILSSAVAAVGNIYNAENMNFYLSLPVHPVKLYLTKLASIVFESGIMFLVFGLPAAAAYVTCLGVDPSFIIVSILVSIPFLLIPVGFSVVIATVFVKLAAKLWNRGLLLLALLGGVLLFLLKRFVDMLDAVNVEEDGKLALIRFIGLFDNPSPTWLPSRWAADILVTFVGVPLQDGGLKVFLLVSTALGSLALGYLCFDLFMHRVRSTAASSNAENAFTRIDITRKVVELIYRLLPLNDQTRALVIKDLTCLVRDRGQALQLLLFLGISMAYLMLFKFTSIGLSFNQLAAEQAWRAFLACMNFLFVGFILTAVMTRLVYPSVSLEGKAFWILLVAPIGLRNLIEAKYRCWLPFTISFTVLLLVSGSVVLGLPLAAILLTALIGIALALGCTGLAIGLGALFASFEWESPNQVTSGLGTLVLFLSSLLMVLALFIPVSGVIALASSTELRRALSAVVSNQSLFESIRPLAISLAPGLAMAACLFTVIFVTSAVGWWARTRGSRSLLRQTLG